MELDAHTLYIMRKHRDLAELYGDAPAAVEAAREGFEKMIAVAAGELESGGPYLLGDDFSGADILLGSVLDWAVAYEVPFPDSLVPYHRRLKKRPGYMKAFEICYLSRPEINPLAKS